MKYWFKARNNLYEDYSKALKEDVAYLQVL